MRRAWLAVVIAVGAVGAIGAGCGKSGASGSTDAPNGGTDAPPGVFDAPANAPDASLGPATLALAHPSRWVPQTGSVGVAFTIARSQKATGPMTVHVTGLPANVTAPDVAVAPGVSTGTLTFSATAAATLESTTSVNVTLADVASTLDTQPFTVNVGGASGSLDTTFGTAGRATLSLPDPAVAGTLGNVSVRAAVQYPASAGADAGKIVVAASLASVGTSFKTTIKVAVARFDKDGTADATFGGGNGYVILDYGLALQLAPAAVALDSQGRILVASQDKGTDTTKPCTLIVARVTEAGVLDGAFTTYNATPPGGAGDKTDCGLASGVTALTGDKVVASATWTNSDSSQRPLLVALTSAGAPDTTAFGGASSIRVANPDTGKPTLGTFQLLSDAQGHYLVPGYKCEGGATTALSACESVVGRVSADGTWDKTFGTAGAGKLGYSAIAFGTTSSNWEQFTRVAVDASGKLVTVGRNDNFAGATIARFGADGTLDTTFATTGHLAPTPIAGGTDEEFDDLAFDDDGRILAVGFAETTGPVVLVSRYSAAGVLDASFGTAGAASAAAGANTPLGALQADGRILVIGAYPHTGTFLDIALWRFWP